MSRSSSGAFVLLVFVSLACASRARSPESEHASLAPSACAFPERPPEARSISPRPAEGAAPEPLLEDGRCEQASTPELRREIKSRMALAALCYEESLSKNPVATSRMLVAIRIEQDGTAASSAKAEQGRDDPRLRRCLASIFGQPYAAHPDDRCVDVRLPIRLRLAAGPAGGSIWSRS